MLTRSGVHVVSTISVLQLTAPHHYHQRCRFLVKDTTVVPEGNIHSYEYTKVLSSRLGRTFLFFFFMAIREHEKGKGWV